MVCIALPAMSNDVKQAMASKSGEISKEPENYSVVKANPSRKKFTARKRAANKIPDDILKNEELAVDIAVLPSNYNFEVCFLITLTILDQHY